MLMTTIEQRLQRVEDIEAIRQLKAAYCDACDDDHNGDAVVALFTANGSWGQGGFEPFVGREAIAEYLFSIRDGKGMQRSAHLVTNPNIEVDGDRAKASWRFVMMYKATEDGAFHRIIGRYEDTYIREQGQWLFQSLIAHVEERGRYAQVTEV